MATIRSYLLLALFTFTLYFSGHAQQVELPQVNEQFWFEYMLNHPFANVYNIEGAFTYSTLLGQPKWRAYDAQVTLERGMSQHVDVMAALLFSYTRQDQMLTSRELRPMIGARFHFTPNKRILTRALLRLESRSINYIEEDVTETKSRTRIRLETLTPLNKATMFAGDKLWYTILDAEWFIINDSDVDERFANRFRLRAGLGYRLSYSTRFEALYTYQSSKNTIEDNFYTSDNIFRIRLKHYLNKSNPSTVSGTGN